MQLLAGWELTKPEITFQVTLSALAGYLLGTPEALNGWHLLGTLTGTGLTAAGVGALNHYLEQDHDAAMRRTARRPLPSGRIAPTTARYLGMLLVFAGIGLLCPVANALTATLALATVVLYLYVYTPLKRRTKYNTLIGTIPGALPALGGWTAATNSLDMGGWTLFAILAVWQMPHFLALAWMYRKDYERAHYKMWPVVEPSGHSTAWQTLGFTALLLPLGASPYLVGVAGPVYLMGSILLGLYFLRPALAFFRTRHVQDARRVLIASVVYIPALTGLIVLDWLLR